MKKSIRIAALACVFAIGAALSGCTSASEYGAHGSRAVLYEDLSAMGADSSAVVLGTVVSQQDVKDIAGSEAAFTVSKFEIRATVNSLDLGANLTTKSQPISAAATIEIRQIGTVTDKSSPTELLEVGREYLLFLTPSGLEGAASSQFYVTGGNAGLYMPATKDSANQRMEDLTFIQVDPQEGESLPREIDSLFKE